MRRGRIEMTDTKPEVGTGGDGPERPVCAVSWSGRVPYDEGMSLMADQLEARREDRAPDALLLVEHEPVLTVGRRGGTEHLVASTSQLIERGIEVHHVGRGGDITYHGPGQLVGYPIVCLRSAGLGARRYVECLEEVIIRTVAAYGIRAGRREGCTGVWVGGEKIAAIGVQISRGLTSHGFALNVSTDLSAFEMIVPCGIADAGVTSIARAAGLGDDDAPSLEDVIPHLVDAFGEIYERRMTWQVATTSKAG
jgi:lipoyl(octanoyl) transferase